MKKLLVLFICFSVLAGVAGLVGCETINPEEPVACKHQFGEWETVQPSDCTVRGRRDRVCELCGEKEVEFSELLAHNFVDGVCTICECGTEVCRHEFGDWYVTTPATCVVAEVVSRDCPLCGLVESETRQTAAHDYGDWVTIKDPECAVLGSKKQVCSSCGNENVVDIEMLGHAYGAWEIKVEPGCETAGTEIHTCDPGIFQSVPMRDRFHCCMDWCWA